MSDKRVSVDVKVGDEHLRLFSEQNGLVVLASVYDVTARRWVAPSEPVNDISHGKQRAVAYAEAYQKTHLQFSATTVKMDQVPIQLSVSISQKIRKIKHARIERVKL
jgi:hypothetical protein